MSRQWTMEEVEEGVRTALRESLLEDDPVELARQDSLLRRDDATLAELGATDLDWLDIIIRIKKAFEIKEIYGDFRPAEVFDAIRAAFDMKAAHLIDAEDGDFA